MSESPETTPLSYGEAERLRDAIAGERRHWHKVEVSPDDIAALLDAARATVPAAEPRKDESWLPESWPSCPVCGTKFHPDDLHDLHSEAVPAADEDRERLTALLVSDRPDSDVVPMTMGQLRTALRAGVSPSTGAPDTEEQP